ncbi:MAG: dehydrogenase [Devosia sp.]|uniref:YciI family protein n=1 Tax=Devosia sp. TaxID=1871048 RepID=UPI0026323E4D|nr:YciI family protein [Devosia sp.]MDB5539318.1 dehydrogenase [Devosia sp.]
MRYLCLVHFDGNEVFGKLDAPGKIQLDIDSLGYNEELEASGNLVATQALQSANTAVLVRVREGRVSTTDGPFIETKEQLAGFILIEARDLNEAIRIASGIPLAKLGTIEVRAIYDIPRHEGAAP